MDSHRVRVAPYLGEWAATKLCRELPVDDAELAALNERTDGCPNDLASFEKPSQDPVGHTLKDALMLACDGLNGLPDAVETIWPRTTVQTCIAHPLPNSFCHASHADCDTLAKALKPVHTPPNEDAATSRFLELSETRGRRIRRS